MEYMIYKLHFTTAVHFGQGTLADTGHRLMADTIFSALCHEAAKEDETGIGELVGWAEKGGLRISDVLPFIGETLYIPKPAVRIQVEQEGDSVIKKQFKKLKYIPIDRVEAYLQGKLDPTEENQRLKQLGYEEVRTLAAGRNKEEPEPFFLGTYRFREGSGLYFLAGFETETIRRRFEDLMQGISYSGIGGKRSAGLGKFRFEGLPFSETALKRKTGNEKTYITLSVAMAKENELGAVLQGARYTLVKRSGFIASTTYAPENTRKRDFYAFQSGSCFRYPFEGGVFDVSGEGRHKVYRYAKPLFLEVE